MLILGVGSSERRAIVAYILYKFGHPMFSPQSELKIDEFMRHFSERFHFISAQ